ncbi:hypothetical protein JCM1840_007590 [Sporobolomyces johnsonii]
MDLPYSGVEKLVMCLDVGTTQSAVSIMHLQPGVLPKIRSVTRWPGDATTAKIPSLVLYDRGVAEYFGAEALEEDGVPASQVYKDWFGYLHKSTKTWFEENSPDGEVIWRKLALSMVFVVAHPNGWETAQQATLRSALQRAVLMLQPEEQIVFVTEAEASVHFSLQYCGNKDWLTASIYEVERTTPKLKLKEIKTSDCVQAGAIFPTRQARVLIADKLKSSKFESGEYIDRIVHEWDVKTKRKFAGLDDGNHIIKFGYDNDTDKSCNIVRGRLTLTPAEVEKAFQPSVDLILQSIDSQLTNTKVRKILLTGGFGESPYVQNRLREKYCTRGIQLIHADEPARKAVAEGAALFYVKDAVIARAARFDYGIEIHQRSAYPKEAGFREMYRGYDGQTRFHGGWSRIVEKGRIIGTNEIISHTYIADAAIGESLVFLDTIYICRNSQLAAGRWLTDEHGVRHRDFESCVTLEADLSPLATAANLKMNPDTGGMYYSLKYRIGIFFGGVSLKACSIWDENNVKLAQIAEDVGFSHALTQIRFMAGYGAEYQHESVSFSQHILANTKKLKVIAAILPGPWNPTLAAKQLASIDHYSNGRIAINVVSGWFKGEFVAINQPWLEHEERYRRSEEFIRALKGIWTAKDSFTFHGNFYQYNSYPLRPQPVQQPHPEVFQGGNSVSARAMAARVSDLLLLNGQKTIADFRELIEDTKRRAVDEGREGQVRFGVNAFVIVRDTEEEALEVWRSIVGNADVDAVKALQKEVQQAGKSSAEGKGMWAQSDINDLVQYNDGFKSKLIGTAQQVANRILLFRSLGIDLVLCAFLHFQEEVERFGKEVIPLVREGELAGRGLDAEKETAISGHIYQ